MIGRVIDRYRIVAKLGQGGMGTVWKAEDPRIGRMVAIKVIAEALADSPEARRRFIREAQAAGRLSHPSIAMVYDVGEVDGLIYIVMPLIDGMNVSNLITSGALHVEFALHIATRVAQALDYAHKMGIVHRDITAKNIMVAPPGRVQVVDFGLALPAGKTRVTGSGGTLGTPGYISPEVLQGREADRRSDLYGLGVVMFEMFTGTPPFTGEHREAIFYATIHKIPEPPSYRNKQIPRWLDLVTQRLLAKNPDRRYQTAAELLEDLSNPEGAEERLASEVGFAPQSEPQNLTDLSDVEFVHSQTGRSLSEQETISIPGLEVAQNDSENEAMEVRSSSSQLDPSVQQRRFYYPIPPAAQNGSEREAIREAAQETTRRIRTFLVIIVGIGIVILAIGAWALSH